ncbi:MAG: transposase [Deltaproteobacteria bacterium]|nr:transposase [Deltaproteobacteria bacterium]
MDRFYPSGKTCSACGAVKPALSLAERVCVCDLCGHARDRDVNAALNIRAEGLRMLGLVIDKNRGTRGVSPDVNLAGPRRHTGSPWALARGMSRPTELSGSLRRGYPAARADQVESFFSKSLGMTGSGRGPGNMKASGERFP